MTEAVVDPLQVVDVDHEEAERRSGSLGPLDLLPQRAVKGAHVEEPGQRVSPRGLGDLRVFLGALERLAGHVSENPAQLDLLLAEIPARLLEAHEQHAPGGLFFDDRNHEDRRADRARGERPPHAGHARIRSRAGDDDRLPIVQRGLDLGVVRQVDRHVVSWDAAIDGRDHAGRAPILVGEDHRYPVGAKDARHELGEPVVHGIRFERARQQGADFERVVEKRARLLLAIQSLGEETDDPAGRQ